MKHLVYSFIFIIALLYVSCPETSVITYDRSVRPGVDEPSGFDFVELKIVDLDCADCDGVPYALSVFVEGGNFDSGIFTISDPSISKDVYSFDIVSDFVSKVLTSDDFAISSFVDYRCRYSLVLDRVVREFMCPDDVMSNILFENLCFNGVSSAYSDGSIYKIAQREDFVPDISRIDESVCDFCNEGYVFNSETGLCDGISYTCSRGVALEGMPAVDGEEHCVSCGVDPLSDPPQYYILHENKCLDFSGCDAGYVFNRDLGICAPPFLLHENGTTVVCDFADWDNLYETDVGEKEEYENGMGYVNNVFEYKDGEFFKVTPLDDSIDAATYVRYRSLDDIRENSSSACTSGVRDMNSLFKGYASRAVVSHWDTSDVEDMAYMFNSVVIGDVEYNFKYWDVSNVRDFSYMFEGSSNAFSGVSNWNLYTGDDSDDVSNVLYVIGMFKNASGFNADLSGWNVSIVRDMREMFRGASAFNGDISTWNTSNVRDMSYMFHGASAFNTYIKDWNTSNVRDMSYMFYGASKFNQDINAYVLKGTWNVGNVLNMSNMFNGASSFDEEC